MTAPDLARYARHYAHTLGLALVPIPHGLKGPREEGWNDPRNTIRTREEAHRVWSGGRLNMGVLHSASGTATLDIDHEAWARQALAAAGVDLDALLCAPVRIKGKNGEKPFYRLPDGCEYGRHALAWPHPSETVTDRKGNTRPVMVTLLELRAGPVQDVLPPSIHPDTGRPYEWAGTPPRSRADIPELPPELRAIWENWEHYAALMRQACPWAAPERPQKARQTTPRTQTPDGEQRPGDAFRERVNIRELLERNGYKRRGERYLPPDSKTKVAGVRILTGDDGVERAFSDHGSCALNDGHAHDSFSALVLLEHAGDVRKAARAAAEELGMAKERPAAPAPQPLTAEQVQAQWEAAQAELITKGCEVLDNAQGNPRQKASLFDLWAIVTELALTNIWERGGRWYINPGGLLNMKANGATGRPADIATRLRFLGSLGFHRGVTKLDPSDPNSPLLIEIPASPHDLPFMALTREASKSLSVQVPTRNQRVAPQKNYYASSQLLRKARPKGSCELALHFSSARQTVAWLIACPGATISELAELRGKHPEVIRRHVRSLIAAGLARREKKGIYLTGTWADYRAALRLERENSEAFRNGVRQALARTIDFCKASLFGRERPPVTAQKRRRHMLEVATLRLARLDAGEPVSEVMRLAA